MVNLIDQMADALRKVTREYADECGMICYKTCTVKSGADCKYSDCFPYKAIQALAAYETIREREDVCEGCKEYHLCFPETRCQMEGHAIGYEMSQCRERKD